MTRTVLCYGDSLTWGWVPTDPVAPTTRYPADQRWPGVLAAALGEGFAVVEEGLSGRTTNVDDPLDPRLNGSTHLPTILASHYPLDVVVLMLGTNDTKQLFGRTPYEIGVGAARLIGQVAASRGGFGTVYPAPRTLLVAPPTPAEHMPDPWLTMQFTGAREKFAGIRDAYAALAASNRIGFFDAGSVVSEVGLDGLHLTAENNRALGEALAPAVRSLLAE